MKMYGLFKNTESGSKSLIAIFVYGDTAANFKHSAYMDDRTVEICEVDVKELDIVTRQKIELGL